MIQKLFSQIKETQKKWEKQKNKQNKKTGSSWLLYRPFESPNSAADSKRNFFFFFLFWGGGE